MTSIAAPVALIGYGQDKKTGEFYIKICKECPDWKQAINQTSPLNFRIGLCAAHVNKRTCERLGEQP